MLERKQLYPHFSVLSPFQRFIPISVFYLHFSVLSPFQRFIPISAFYPHFSVLSPFQRFIPISVSVFSFRFPISAFYPHFSFRFQFPFPPFSFSVLSRPYILARISKLLLLDIVDTARLSSFKDDLSCSRASILFSKIAFRTAAYKPLLDIVK